MKSSSAIGNLLIFGLLPLISGCSSFLYYPTNLRYVDPEKLEYRPKEVSMKLQDGLTVDGWWFSTTEKNRKGVILQFHGNGGNRTGHFTRMYWVLKYGYDLVIFDYPGYGSTEGKPTPKSTVQMAKQAMRFVRTQAPHLPLIVYGQSLGGAVAMRAVWEMRNEIKPEFLIVDSTFLSYRRVARKALSKNSLTWILQPFTWLVLSDRWAPGKKVSEVGVPVLVIHSRADEIVPFELGEEVFARAAEPKEFFPLEKDTHNGPFNLQLRSKLMKLIDQKKR